MKNLINAFVIFLIAIATILGDMINLAKFIPGDRNFSIKGIVISVIFVAVWLLAAAIFGYMNNEKYITYSTQYFSILFGISLVAFILSLCEFNVFLHGITLFLTVITAFLVDIPLYGFVEVFNQVNQLTICFASIFLLGALNFFIFYVVKSISSKK